MLQNWKATYIIASTLLVVTAMSILVWKKKRNFVKVGKVSKLFFFPVKSLKAIEVKKGMCSKLGFIVNGLLDRSFMLVDGNRKVITQREQPSLVLLTQRLDKRTVIISASTEEELKVPIKDSISPDDIIYDCSIFTDSTKAVDCGDEAALFFQSYLNTSDVRLMQQVPTLTGRKYLAHNAFERKVRKDHPIGLQDFSPFHIVSHASIHDLNSKVKNQDISVFNFRPNILVDECQAYSEDTWKYIKFISGAIMSNIVITPRCLLTTNTPSTGVLTQKEPLVTMRKFRIPNDPGLFKKIGSAPCLGIYCGVEQSGDISVGDDIFADIGEKPPMRQK